MFTAVYYALRYFASRFFPKVGEDGVATSGSVRAVVSFRATAGVDEPVLVAGVRSVAGFRATADGVVTLEPR